ncbi:MAG: ATP-dependent helicase HrpB [Altererythrobacter sp.]|uniref:ATP-dependent helicase HrpB n=1 Tax=Altererythrobacter sp. TaxID=1872480 RepID=UPI001B1860D2|nr:ATP-dependent helicase HrpB [Altererythrobacter sp.]MBO6641109.1 ATP-dependent helicase HrpB [Altererythrobacter sp.]MBO6708193.1 ATP-dependent helicase HrpB [Altererythrobacter sp.]
MPLELPINEKLGDLSTALADIGAAVLVAPPGAGKTTAVAPALLDEDWCSGQIILTSPRRVAARAAAERMAELLGEKPGQTVGYLTRLDRKSSAKTRILVVTEAIFVNRIVEDPDLSGVSAVLFDEAHERHLDSDLGLALALESRSVLREDLRVLVMSATIDGARFARLLGEDAPVVESKGRAHPLRIEWLGSKPDLRIEDAMSDAVMQAWREQQGDILAFLPGVSEIERVRERLESRLPDAPILPLHGQVQPAEQRAAIRRNAEGRRRIVLATAIAETSLTLDGVSMVVDSGLARNAVFDKAAGTTHLVTERASQAAAAQRAGRAARQGPGVAYRLWEEHGHAGRPEFAPPEIETADLASLVLKLARWGATEPADLLWLDPPPDAAVATARSSLVKLGALDKDGRITPRGEKIASLPLDPVGAAVVLLGAEASQALDAAKLVLLLQERGLGGRGEDLLRRLDRWNGDRGKRAEASRKLAQNWAKAAERLVSSAESDQHNPALFLALARPDFVAKRRDKSGEQWLSAGGRGFQLDPASPLARAEWIVIGDAQGRAKGARITAAAELSAQEIEEHLQNLIEKCSVINWNSTEKRVETRLEKRLGSIILASGPDPDPDPEAVVDKLVEKGLERLENLVPADLLARGKFAQIETLSLESLRDSAELWLRPLFERRRDLDLPLGKFTDAILNGLEWEVRQRLDKLAPREFLSPAGTRHAIDYASDDAPCAEVRVQALFGLDRHPMIGSTPLLIKLTSPAGRPIQSTRDLPGFWRGSWADVKKDMKGRYPKHRWPDEPWVEKPSLKTKNAFNRSEN